MLRKITCILINTQGRIAMKKIKIFMSTVAVLFMFSFLMSACNPDPTPPPDLNTPTDPTPQDAYLIDTLTGSDNATTRLNQNKLESLVHDINLGDYDNIHSLVIIHNDELILEEYFGGWDRDRLHPCYSVTKSVSSALIGIAIGKGYISGTDAKLLDFFPEYETIGNYDERKESITLEHVLTMTAGFEWDEESTPIIDSDGNPNPENSWGNMFQSEDWIKHVLDLPLATDPGTEFVYNTGCSHLLSGILYNTTGLTAEEFAEETLFSALGITEWDFRKDPMGLNTTGSGLALHPTNMAMFGYLYLNRGMINGVQVVPESWVEASVDRNIAVEVDSSGMNEYGYQWWLISENYPVYDLENFGDMYYAAGYGGQYIAVIPKINMVAVITADDVEQPVRPFVRVLLLGVLPAVEEVE
jgi:CubicO group peptidase (beta-lactamase class C family)